MTPQFVDLFIETLTPGGRDDYDMIERQIADLCAREGCPNHYLALEPVDGAEEVWWLNVYGTEAEREQVQLRYAERSDLMNEMNRLSDLKKSFTSESRAVNVRQRSADGGAQWSLAGARFFVIGEISTPTAAMSEVYETQTGTRFVVAPAASRLVAEMNVKTWGAGRVFAIRPEWSFPDDRWVAADRVFWRPSTVA